MMTTRSISVLLISLAFAGCGSRIDSEKLTRQLAGTWYTTNKTGRVLAFAEDGRVLMFATATRGTFFNNATYVDGDVLFTLESQDDGTILKFSKRDPSVQGDVDEEFRLISIEDDEMVLERRKHNTPVTKPTTLKRLDSSPLAADKVRERLPDEGYLFVPADAETMSIDDF